MSKRIWDIGDTEPEGVISVVEVDESGNVQWSDSMNGDSLSDAVIDTAKMNNPYRSNDE